MLPPLFFWTGVALVVLYIINKLECERKRGFPGEAFKEYDRLSEEEQEQLFTISCGIQESQKRKPLGMYQLFILNTINNGNANQFRQMVRELTEQCYDCINGVYDMVGEDAIISMIGEDEYTRLMELQNEMNEYFKAS